MRTRLLLGPSGSGKTYRCLAEVRAALSDSRSETPLIFIAPKQSTFQIEQQLLADGNVQGYSRLQILSFERLGYHLLQQIRGFCSELLSEDGRVMVLRALIMKHREVLGIFRATANLQSFAEELSAVLRELQAAGLPLERIDEAVRRQQTRSDLQLKVHDFLILQSAYQDWLRQHNLRDPSELLSMAAEVLEEVPLQPGTARPFAPPKLWLDGFSELTGQELNLLLKLLPLCEEATLAFNLAADMGQDEPWLSPWASAGTTVRKLKQRLAENHTDVSMNWLERREAQSRFAANPVLRHLEEHWVDLQPYGTAQPSRPAAEPLMAAAPPVSRPVLAAENRFALRSRKRRPAKDDFQLEFYWTPPAAPVSPPPPGALASVSPGGESSAANSAAKPEGLRILECHGLEDEAIAAAREVLRFVRGGARFRDIAIVVRDLDVYQGVVRRVLARYDIPCFIDRRALAGCHPLVELTRCALRTITFDWRDEDWFGALKTRLVPATEEEIDLLENEALARGWSGRKWRAAFPPEASSLEGLRQRLVRPFEQFLANLGTSPNGELLARSLRSLWDDLDVPGQLERWHSDGGEALHLTLWEQMQDWLANIVMAFGPERMPMREWIPILEAGLSRQTVGVVPAAVDQVLVGAVDRSRNPDLAAVILLGFNEGIFPARSKGARLLTDYEREELMDLGVRAGQTNRTHFAQEEYFGYIACTRASRQLMITYSLRDPQGTVLNPSPFVTRLQRIFPALVIERFTGADARSIVHRSELLGPWARLFFSQSPSRPSAPEFRQGLWNQPGLADFRAAFESWKILREPLSLSAESAERLYGTELRTSVSGLEDFAACPFKFFVKSGMRAKPRKRFELDAREQGTFQHEVLALYHHKLAGEGKRWRDLSPEGARAEIGQLAESMIPTYNNGLLASRPEARFAARQMSLRLQDFAEVLTRWLHDQYRFEPQAVELAFGTPEAPLPAWAIPLTDGHGVSFRGKIDRIDLHLMGDSGDALCVVIDYKSSSKKLDPVLCGHGVQLQLLAYLNVLTQFPEPERFFPARRLVPAGVFYVNLRGAPAAAGTRREALENDDSRESRTFQHSGRFNQEFLKVLDVNASEPSRKGNQFRYQTKKDGTLTASSKEAMTPEDFAKLLGSVRGNVIRMATAIYAGEVKLDPYQKSGQSACALCEYQSICRIDPWTHPFRVLSSNPAGA